MPERDEYDSASLFPDYVVECEEHLTAAGRVLLSLEASPERFDTAQLDSLFRNFHTVKGLSAMVGLHEAERLSHHLESYLGAIRKGRLALTQNGVAILIEGVKSLERVIAARVDGLSVPSVDDLVGRVASLLPEDITKAPSPSDPPPILIEPRPDPYARANAAVREGAVVWRIQFKPSPELTARGLTVNAVRERLRAAGEIVHAEPTVVPGGVTFTFLVVGAAADIGAEFRDEGLTVERYEPPAVADITEPTSVAMPRRTSSLTPANLVRVDLGRLDDLMRMVGDLVISRARLDNGLGRVAASLTAAELRELQETSRTMESHIRNLREGVMRVRLVPVRDVFARMRFVVRDLARETAKEIDLRLEGEDTEIDKFVVERLADPLLHLIRNAVSHGLEPPAERAAAGKPSRGRIVLRAAASGGVIVIEVEDDGRGIDAERVFSRARAAGLVPSDATTDPAEVLGLLCSPGFSTRDGTDRESGRGVGMDVAAQAVEGLGGTLSLSTQIGQGSRFTARLPLTLAIAEALIVAVAGQIFAIPQTAVREVIAVASGTPTVLENNELLPHRGSVYPLLRLADVFGLGGTESQFVALIIGEGSPVALAADHILGLREIVVRPLADPLVQVAGIAGATELGDGRAVLILDTAGLARFARSDRRLTG